MKQPADPQMVVEALEELQRTQKQETLGQSLD